MPELAAHLERAKELALEVARSVKASTIDMRSRLHREPRIAEYAEILGPILAAALAACAREEAKRLEGRIVMAELGAQIIEATWWNEEGLDLENYISPVDAEKRLNFLRNTLKEVRAERAVGEKAT